MSKNAPADSVPARTGDDELLQGGPTRQRRNPEIHVPGEEGLWVLVFFDMTVFATLFGVFLYYRAQYPAEFESAARLHTVLGGLNTGILLTSSLFVVIAVRAVRLSRPKESSTLLLAAIGLGLAFIAVKAIEWTLMLRAGLGPASSTFFATYYVTTGLHLLHVAVGLTLLCCLLPIVCKEDVLTTRRRFLEGGAVFWHMVDLLWLVIFALYYMIPV